MIVLLTLSLLAADGRPEWWQAPPMGLDMKGAAFVETGGQVCLDAPSATRLAGVLERCKAYPPIVDRQLGALFDLHLSSIRAADAQGLLNAERRAAILSAESDSRWPAWQVAILGVGIAAAGILLGGAVVLGYGALHQ